MSSADELSGGLGTDTLDTRVTAADQIIAPLLSDIEKVYIQVDGADTRTFEFDASDSTGITELWLKNASAVSPAGNDELVTFSGVALTTTVGIEGGEDDVELTVEYASTTGTNTVAFAFNGAEASVVTAAGVEVLNVSTAGDASVITTLTTAAATTLNVTGSGDLEITGALANTLKTVDASAFTGDLDIRIGYGVTAATRALSVEGGDGNDTVNVIGILGTTDTVNASASILIDGGAGVDTIEVEEDFNSNVSLTTEVVNFEQIMLSADEEFNVNGITWLERFIVNADITDDTISNVLTSTVVELKAEAITDVTIAHKNAGAAGTQVLNLAIGNADGDVVVGTLSIDGVETVTIHSFGTDGNDLQGIESDALRDLVITGDKDLTITLDDANGVGSSVNASAFTGALTLELNGAAQTTALEITGGSGGDSIVIDASDQAAHVITLGSGADTITFEDADVAANVAASIADQVIITGFEGGDGGDVLRFLTAAAAGQVATADELADIQDAVDAALAADAGLTVAEAFEAAYGGWTGAADDVIFFEFGGNTYVVYEDGTATTTFDADEDYSIKLVGTDLGLDRGENFLFAAT